jgi:hypothetical protein
MRNDNFVIVATTLHAIHHKSHQSVRGYPDQPLDEFSSLKSLLLLRDIDINAEMASNRYHPDPAQPHVENAVIELLRS